MNREGAQIGWMELWMEEGGKGEDGLKVRRNLKASGLQNDHRLRLTQLRVFRKHYHN